ncbi:hypothetical protein KC333_g5136 [Hortaea werneckii]|nr:hypothetical protein KC333_g5136 [Hortaea werneckii]KAI7314187.1 hypothetical protein KC326_g5174 [Hortaea werneckii]
MHHPVARVGVAGATGKFAGLILDSLLGNPTVQIRGYCRNPSKLAPRFSQSPQVEVITGEADDGAALSRFADGLDVVICAYLGDNDFMINAQKALIDACDGAHVARYIASDYCLDYTQLKLGDHPAKDPMKIIHSYLQETKHVKGVHILIGAFMETFWSSYFQVWHADSNSLKYWGTGEEPWESTTYGDAARFTAAVALDSSAVGMQKFLGDRKNIFQIAQAMNKTYGVQPKLQCQGSLEDLRRVMHETFAKDPSNIYAWLALYYQYYCTNGQAEISHDLDNQKYPDVKPQTFEDFLGTHDLHSLSSSMDNLLIN